jgi:hypothetical protein
MGRRLRLGGKQSWAPSAGRKTACSRLSNFTQPQLRNLNTRRNPYFRVVRTSNWRIGHLLDFVELFVGSQAHLGFPEN